MTTKDLRRKEGISLRRSLGVMASRILENHFSREVVLPLLLIVVREADAELVSLLATEIIEQEPELIEIERVLEDDLPTLSLAKRNIILVTSVVVDGVQEKVRMEKIREIAPGSTIELVAIVEFEHLDLPLEVNSVRALPNPPKGFRVEISFGEDGIMEITHEEGKDDE